MTEYKKAITAGVALAVAIANGFGWEVPQDVIDGVIALLIWAGGTFGVFQLANRPKDHARRLNSPPVVGVIALAVGALMLAAACAGTRQAYQAAEGLNETAKVVAEHYYALVEELNALDDAGELSPSALSHTQDLVRKTRPLILELGNAGMAYETVTEAIAMQDAAADAEDEAAIAAAEAELEAAVADAAIAVSDLVDAIKAAADGSARLERIREDLAPLVAAAA